MITDPRFAPRRDDLPYLRRRRRPRSAPAAETARPGISFDRPAHKPAPAPEPPPSPRISFDRPQRREEPPSPVPAPPASTSLDLDSAASPPPSAPTPPVSTSLDLDRPTAAPPAAGAVAARPPGEPARRLRADVRVRAGQRRILTVAEPTVTLSRLQSGIGTLRFEAACSDEVGDLRLGAAYQLASGLSSTVALPRRRLGPPDSRRPVLVAGQDRFATLAVDLRQCRELRRLAILAFSESRSPLHWGGTLVAETFGGARIEVPLETLRGGQVAVLMSLYNVRGEFVLRAEMQTLDGDVREACRAYGYERITWLDSRTPVD